MSSYQDEIVVLLHSVSHGFITAGNAELPGYKKLQSSLGVKQSLTLESYGAKIVKNAHFRCRVVIQIVTKRSRELCYLPAVGSGSVIRCTSQVELGTDDSHVGHWSNSDLVVTPAIRIHHAKVTQPEIGSGVEVGDVGLAEESEVSTKRPGTTPLGLSVLAQEFVFTAFCPVGESD